MPRLLFVIFLLTYSLLFAQIDPGKLDSLSHRIDSNGQSLQAWQDSFQKKQDSIYRLHVNTSKDALSKERFIGRKRTMIFTIVGIILFTILFLAFLVRRKNKI
jgi:hypothetical protein